MSETGALAYWFDIAPEIRREWLDWYLTDHMPSRVGTAFVTGRCYEAIDATASHMVLFETPTPEDLLAPSYLALLRQVSQRLQRVVGDRGLVGRQGGDEFKILLPGRQDQAMLAQLAGQARVLLNRA